ncbi:uncharacterized protein LOC116415279 [Apis florea]|uniref:uncharacterized protein LOC116415279 n=1 Tax=Apis florea TaxID=7463 RepID=UPI0012FF1A18|nr:uncharacterized protein LOC116415279 [Apis florea]
MHSMGNYIENYQQVCSIHKPAMTIIGNEWLYNPELLKPSRYLDALRLRTNTYGTRVALRRAKKDTNELSEMRRPGRDSRTHIGTMHPHKKPENRRRHDEICDLIMNNIPKNNAILREPEIVVNGEMRRADMVLLYRTWGDASARHSLDNTRYGVWLRAPPEKVPVPNFVRKVTTGTGGQGQLTGLWRPSVHSDLKNPGEVHVEVSRSMSPRLSRKASLADVPGLSELNGAWSCISHPGSRSRALASRGSSLLRGFRGGSVIVVALFGRHSTLNS